MDWKKSGIRILKPALFVALSIPLAKGLYDTFTGGLGGNPIEELTHRTGWWTICILIGTLAVTPLRRLTGWNQLIKVRRMVGLFALLYASLHFTVYIALDLYFYFPEVIEDISKRPFITVGFAALLILIALGVTSNAWSIRKLGGKRWNALHRLVYLAAGLGVFHFLWLVKADTRRPVILGLILVVLLATRLIPRGWFRRASRSRGGATRRQLVGG
jgi:sulfoxide reductase heme-binding subunit YedZ